MPLLRVDCPSRQLRARERSLVAALGLERTGEERIECLLLDSPDGRLVREQSLIEARDPLGAGTLVWTELDLIGERGRIADAPAPPLRVRELPAGPVRDRLAAVLGDRTLFAVGRLRHLRRTWQARDARGKIVLRVFVDSAIECGRPGDASLHRVPDQLHVEGLRGYPAAFDAARAVVDSWPDARIDPTPWGAVLLRFASTPPDDEAAAPVSVSDFMLTAAEGFRRVFCVQLAAIEANAPKAAEALDPEFLHDLRVAIRRTRTLLAAAERVLPRSLREHFAAEFAWFGGETSRLRDLDVYLLHFDAFVQRTPHAGPDDLEPLRALLQEHQRVEREKVAATLRGERARDLLARWGAALQPGAIADWPASRSAASLASVAVDRVRRAERRLLELGRTIDESSTDAQLHELRKRAKKLRYLLEFFGEVIDHHAARARVTELKALQDLLGAHQDRAVQITALGHFAEELGGDPVDTARAMGALVERLDEERRQLRADFTARFAAYDDERAREKFAAALDRIATGARG